MRIFGTILNLLAIVALIIGVVTAVLIYSSGTRIYDKLQMLRGIVEEDVDLVQDAFRDVDRVFTDSRSVLDDYERGRINSVEDERVRDIFNRISDTMTKTRSVKEKSEKDIELVEGLVGEVTSEGMALIPVAATSIVSLVVSGWLFGIGMYFRALGARNRS